MLILTLKTVECPLARVQNQRAPLRGSECPDKKRLGGNRMPPKRLYRWYPRLSIEQEPSASSTCRRRLPP
jgi:hypothetical protein